MAIAVNLDFENPYEIHPLTEDLRINAFETELQDGSTMPLKVEIAMNPTNYYQRFLILLSVL